MRSSARILTALLLLGALAVLPSCAETWLGPVEPVTPPAPPPPIVDPVTPPAPAQVVPYVTISAIAPGTPKADVLAAVGVAPALESVQDNGTTTARWATTNAEGAPRWVVFTFDTGGRVIGHVLVPRVLFP